MSPADAIKVAGGDGFYAAVDPTNPNTIYAESQFGNLQRLDRATGARKTIKPRSQRGQPRLRFNWSSPLRVSPHNPFTVYFGSQYLHRSRNRGDRWVTISPDLSTNDADKLTGNVPHCTITTISESPRREGTIWVGTDDGKVWVTKNDGGRWTDLTDRFDGMPKPLWVSRVEASPADPEVAYVSFTGYREDIRAPYLYLTTDGGESFRSIANNLPQAPINVVREHPRNPDVLFVGTEFGVFASVDAGASWQPLGRDLPTTPVHDLLVHPREDDLVLGSHGRGLFVCDITPLAQLNTEILAKPFHAFPPRGGHLLPRGFAQGNVGARGWRGRNPELGAVFRYYLGKATEQSIEVEVLDATGRQLYSRGGGKDAGMHDVVWNPRGRAGARGRGRGSQRGRGGRARGGQRGSRTAPSGPGQYLVRITWGDTVVEQPFWIHDGMAAAPGALTTGAGR